MKCSTQNNLFKNYRFYFYLLQIFSAAYNLIYYTMVSVLRRRPVADVDGLRQLRDNTLRSYIGITEKFKTLLYKELGITPKSKEKDLFSDTVTG